MDEALVASALKLATWARRGDGSGLDDLIHHNDRGVQYSARHFAELLGLYGISLSMGSVGDAYDNALAETIIGSCKTELIKNPVYAPWRSFEQLQLETARWVHWHNNSNITKRNDWHTPMEIEEMYNTLGIDARKASA